MTGLSGWWSGMLPADPEPRLYGDELMAALEPTVARLIVAVHDRDAEGVAAALAEAGRLAGDPIVAATHLAVLAAALADPDKTMADQLGWTLYTAARQEGNAA